MLTPQEIKTFIDNDAASRKKQFARTGQRYYEADHDIRQYRIFYVDGEGNLREDETRSNIKIAHPFFTELVDQEVQYTLSGDGRFIRSDDPELQKWLDTYFNESEDFVEALYDFLTDCSVKGFAYMYTHKNADNRTSFQCADSIGVVEVRETETDDKCAYVIYWYVDTIGKNNQQIKRIEVWDSEKVWYYCQIDDGEIELDTNKEINPSPHNLYKKGKDDKLYYKGFGFIPFLRMDYCKKQFSSLKPIKDLIDDFDMMACGLSNNIQDTNEALYVVHGFQGDNLDELMMNIRAKKHVGVDEDGGVDIKTIDIPYEARQAKLEIDKEGIYHFGMGVNTSGLKDSSATVSIAVKAAYSLLDMKTNKLVIRLKQFLRKLLKIVLAEVNEQNGTDYQQSDVYFCFEPEVPTNALENAQIELTDAQKQQVQINNLLSIATYLDNETLMQNICDVLDIDYEEIKDRLPVQEEPDPYAAQTALNGIAPAQQGEPDGGGVIE